MRSETEIREEAARAKQIWQAKGQRSDMMEYTTLEWVLEGPPRYSVEEWEKLHARSSARMVNEYLRVNRKETVEKILEETK